MKVRILTEQNSHNSVTGDTYASGSEVDLPAEQAKELLNSGVAEPIAQKPASRAEKRPSRGAIETR